MCSFWPQLGWAKPSGFLSAAGGLPDPRFLAFARPIFFFFFFFFPPPFRSVCAKRPVRPRTARHRSVGCASRSCWHLALWAGVHLLPTVIGHSFLFFPSWAALFYHCRSHADRGPAQAQHIGDSPLAGAACGDFWSAVVQRPASWGGFTDTTGCLGLLVYGALLWAHRLLIGVHDP